MHGAGVIAVEREPPFELDLRFVHSVLISTQNPQVNVRGRVVVIAFEGFDEQLLGACFILIRRFAPPEGYIVNQDACDSDPGTDRFRVQLQRLLECLLGLLPIDLGCRPVEPGPAAHYEIARIGVFFLRDLATCRFQKLTFERLRQAADYLALRLRQVCQVGIEPIGPNMSAGLGVDQLRIDLNRFTQPPHAAFENMANAEILTDLLYVDRFTLVGEGGGARDYKAIVDPGEVGGQIVGDRVDEIVLPRVV